MEVNENKQSEENSGESKVEPIVLRRPHQAVYQPPKKGSIFKSRGAAGSEKRNARYIHNWCDTLKDEGEIVLNILIQ